VIDGNHRIQRRNVPAGVSGAAEDAMSGEKPENMPYGFPGIVSKILSHTSFYFFPKDFPPGNLITVISFLY